MSDPYHAGFKRGIGALTCHNLHIFVLFYLADIAYIIGGSTDPNDCMAMSYEVTTVNLKTGEVRQAEDTLHVANAAAAASSLTRIVVCGGLLRTTPLNYCRIYSPDRDK